MNTEHKKSNRPELFEKGSKPFWTDPYIARQMLDVHLNPETEKASRKPDFINASIEWINSLIPENSEILDLGCGPGLYVEKLSALGHDCKGIDFSEVSINYAKEHTRNVNYIQGDYLTTDFGSNLDLIILIYCDFGVFSVEEQKLLLKKIYASLKPGGCFIFDVFTYHHFNSFPEEFEITEADGGFWSEGKHQLIKESYKYPEANVVLGQYHLIREDSRELFRIWSQCYSQNDIESLVKEAGFTIKSIHSDVKGYAFSEESETIGLVCEK